MAARKRGRRISAAAAAAETTSRDELVVRVPLPERRSISSLFISILFFSAIILVVFLLLYFKANGGGTYITVYPDNPILSVYERGLVKREITYREVLSECKRVSSNASVRQFSNPVLAYVTPWNSLGYELAEKFRFKLTHVSPVWYELKIEKKKYFLDGRHISDPEWISRIKSNQNLVVLPRVALEVPPSDMLKSKRQWEKVIDIIASECKEMRYDGIVLESWSRWAVHGVLRDIDMRRRALEFVKELATRLHFVGLELVFVIPAPRSSQVYEYDFGHDDLGQLVDFVDGFSLMTYDFSGPHSPGPNAPLPWIRSTLKLLVGDDERETAQKIFVGMNFYGNDFHLSEGLGSESITGRDYLSLLQNHKPPLQWEAESSEHFFIYFDDRARRHAVFYPSLISISLRLHEALSLGASLSIWEIGQGLDYFFDLL